jgi:hypothetical protein
LCEEIDAILDDQAVDPSTREDELQVHAVRTVLRTVADQPDHLLVLLEVAPLGPSITAQVMTQLLRVNNDLKVTYGEAVVIDNSAICLRACLPRSAELRGHAMADWLLLYADLVHELREELQLHPSPRPSDINRLA